MNEAETTLAPSVHTSASGAGTQPWETALENLAREIRYSRDAWGNAFVWCSLSKAETLPLAAQDLARHGARLCTVTAQARALYSDAAIVLSYHFDVHGTTVTVQTPLEPGENSVPTIMPWFRNADWNEREFAELYDVHVQGRGTMERLFLDPDIEEGILNEVIPLTIMMNGACTTDMWERIMSTNKTTVPGSAFPQGKEPGTHPERVDAGTASALVAPGSTTEPESANPSVPSSSTTVEDKA